MKSYDFLANILSGMQDMVRVVDLDGEIVFINKVMEEKFGNSLGKKCYEYLNQELPCDNCISKICIKEGKVTRKEVEVENRFYSVISSPVWNENKHAYYAVEVFRDITERKNMEELIYAQYKKMKYDLELAKQLQSKVLPIDKVFNNSLKITSKYIPSEILGGDIYDVIEIDSNYTAIYIADVSGHGVPASMLTMFLRQAVRNKNICLTNPLDAIGEVLDAYKYLNVDYEKYITILYGIYDKNKEEITFINAGHNCMPLIIREDSVEEISIKGMPICSILDEVNHEIVKVKVNKGDKVLLYTDGILEKYNEKMDKYFGEEGVINILNRNKDVEDEELIDAIIRESDKFSTDEIKDDVAIMVAQII